MLGASGGGRARRARAEQSCTRPHSDARVPKDVDGGTAADAVAAAATDGGAPCLERARADTLVL
jgi:hypothetical protein